MRYNIIIYIKAIICAVEWKRLFSVLKNLQNHLFRGTLKFSIFLRNLCDQPILIFFTS